MELGVYFGQKNNLVAHCSPIGNKFDEFFTTILNDGECHLMQSTGLFDVNGQEIFEGDLVRSTWFKDYDDLVGYRKLGKVAYRNGYFGIEYPGDAEKGYPTTILDFSINVEIIGNVFDNPELIEGV